MLKILLVDDEEIIKSGLRREVRWEDLGCLIAGEASDGAEALELIRKDPPDIVISVHPYALQGWSDPDGRGPAGISGSLLSVYKRT